MPDPAAPGGWGDFLQEHCRFHSPRGRRRCADLRPAFLPALAEERARVGRAPAPAPQRPGTWPRPRRGHEACSASPLTMRRKVSTATLPTSPDSSRGLPRRMRIGARTMAVALGSCSNLRLLAYDGQRGQEREMDPKLASKYSRQILFAPIGEAGQ